MSQINLEQNNMMHYTDLLTRGILKGQRSHVYLQLLNIGEATAHEICYELAYKNIFITENNIASRLCELKDMCLVVPYYKKGNRTVYYPRYYGVPHMRNRSNRPKISNMLKEIRKDYDKMSDEEIKKYIDYLIDMYRE